MTSTYRVTFGNGEIVAQLLTNEQADKFVRSCSKANSEADYLVIRESDNRIQAVVRNGFYVMNLELQHTTEKLHLLERVMKLEEEIAKILDAGEDLHQLVGFHVGRFSVSDFEQLDNATLLRAIDNRRYILAKYAKK